MRFFLDTANLEEIKKAEDFGVLDGVTTNPSLMAREGGDWRAVAKAICREVDGPVSLEVLGLTMDEMIAEAQMLMEMGSNAVIKIPMTHDGVRAMKALREMDIPVNATLIFSPLQGLMAAKAGASYLSPFVGRLDDIGHNGMEIVSQIQTMVEQYGFDTEVLVASVRSVGHVLEAAMLGVDIATIPFKILSQMINHPLTNKGLEIFLKDAEGIRW